MYSPARRLSGIAVACPISFTVHPYRFLSPSAQMDHIEKATEMACSAPAWTWSMLADDPGSIAALAPCLSGAGGRVRPTVEAARHSTPPLAYRATPRTVVDYRETVPHIFQF